MWATLATTVLILLLCAVVDGRVSNIVCGDCDAAPAGCSKGCPVETIEEEPSEEEPSEEELKKIVLSALAKHVVVWADWYVPVIVLCSGCTWLVSMLDGPIGA